MRKEFKEWMTKKDKITENVATQYSTAISYISKHYSKQINENFDIYKIDDIDFIYDLVDKYGKKGKYEKIGKERNGTVRAAINAYARFLKNRKSNYDSQDELNHKTNSIFIEEKHLESNNKKEFKKWMISQKNLEISTASNYITGINKISNHYSQINKKKLIYLI